MKLIHGQIQYIEFYSRDIEKAKDTVNDSVDAGAGSDSGDSGSDGADFDGGDFGD